MTGSVAAGKERSGGAGRLQELVLISHLGKGECVMISSIYPMETPRRRGEIICAQSHGGAVGKSALETQVLLQRRHPSRCCLLSVEKWEAVCGSHQAEELGLHPEGKEHP